jgi:hypothetical protein
MTKNQILILRITMPLALSLNAIVKETILDIVVGN